MNTFLSSKNEFDDLYKNEKIFRAFLPVHLTENKDCLIKDKYNMHLKTTTNGSFFIL